jgi:hypothetical protein
MVTERALPSAQAQIEVMHAIGRLEDETVGTNSFARPY